MSEKSDLLNFIYPNHSKVLCDGIMGLYKSKAWTDLALKVNGCETLVHTFMLGLFAPKLISHCEDNRCDLQGFNVDQHTISTLLDFIYKGQVKVERHRLDSIRRGADQLGFNLLSQLISEETNQDSIESLSIETETNNQVIPHINCDKSLNIGKDAILQCSRCDFKVEIIDEFKVTLMEDFKNHLANVHNVNFDTDAVKLSYKCRECDFEGEDTQVLVRHWTSRHVIMKIPTYKCCNCDFVADKKSTVIRHLKSVHKTMKSLKCPECDFRTNSEKRLEAHQMSEHTGDYVCDECGRKFTTHAGRQNHHMLIHLQPESRHACRLCSFKTKLMADLKKHLADEHNIGRKRIKRHGSYNEIKQCTHCGAVLRNMTYLIDHLAGKHRVDLDGNPIEPKYKCRSCDFVTYSHSQLRRHKYNTHPKLEFRCDHCVFKCRSRSVLQDHIRWKHFGERPYMCEVCGLSFGIKMFLYSHRKLHETKSKPFQCEICEKCFTQKHQLKQHIRHMHDENARTHQCQLCSYAGKTKWSLANHVKARHKELTFQVVKEGEDIRESDIAIMQVENYELAVEHAESL